MTLRKQASPGLMSSISKYWNGLDQSTRDTVYGAGAGTAAGLIGGHLTGTNKGYTAAGGAIIGGLAGRYGRDLTMPKAAPIVGAPIPKPKPSMDFKPEDKWVQDSSDADVLEKAIQHGVAIRKGPKNIAKRIMKDIREAVV